MVSTVIQLLNVLHAQLVVLNVLVQLLALHVNLDILELPVSNAPLTVINVQLKINVTKQMDAKKDSLILKLLKLVPLHSHVNQTNTMMQLKTLVLTVERIV